MHLEFTDIFTDVSLDICLVLARYRFVLGVEPCDDSRKSEEKIVFKNSTDYKYGGKNSRFQVWNGLMADEIVPVFL